MFSEKTKSTDISKHCFDKMEKTIGNIKKFLHIKSKSEKKEKLEIIPEKTIVNQQSISTTLEISGEGVKRRYINSYYFTPSNALCKDSF